MNPSTLIHITNAVPASQAAAAAPPPPSTSMATSTTTSPQGALNLTLNSAGLMNALGTESGVTTSVVAPGGAWCQQHQPLFTRLLKQAVIDMCMQNLAWDGKLEIDGIMCVSNGMDPNRQIIIKVHEALIKQSLNELPKVPLVPLKIPATVSTAGSKTTTTPSTNASGASNSKKTSPSTQGQKGGSPRKVAGRANSANGQPMPLMRSLLSKAIATQKNAQKNNQGKVVRRPLSMVLPRTPGADSGDSEHSENQENEETGDPGLSEEVCEADGTKSYQCKSCSIKFQGFNELQVHNQENHKRYTCRQCSATFSLRCNLRRHERLHAGVKPHACNFCKKSFSRAADLRAHIKKHAASKAMDVITCSQCPKSFKSALSLRVHMFKVHKLKDSVYACSICEKVFEDPDDFQAHRATHTASLVSIGRTLAKFNDGTPSGSPSHLSIASAFTNEFDTDLGSQSDDGLVPEHTDDALAMTEEYNGGMEDTDKTGGAMNLSIVKSEPQDNATTSSKQASHELHSQVQGVSCNSHEDPMISHRELPDGSRMAYGDMNYDEEDAEFDRPLVINIMPELEQDGDSGSNPSRTNRRKSRPVRIVPEMEGLPTENHGGLDLSVKGGNTQDVLAPLENHNPLDANVGCDDDLPCAKRPRLDQPTLVTPAPPVPTTIIKLNTPVPLMQYESLESLMLRVNESLYKNCNYTPSTPTAKGFKGIKKLLPKPSSTPPSGSKSSKKKKVLGDKPSSGSDSFMESPMATNRVLSVVPTEENMAFKQFICNQWGCATTVTGFSSYEEHSLSVHGRFPCKYCTQTFSGRNNRTRHVRYHLTGKQYQCADCGKFFTRPDSLKEHRFIHTRSYQESHCINCNVPFEKKATLLSHLKKCFSEQQIELDKHLTPADLESKAEMMDKFKTPGRNLKIENDDLVPWTPVGPKSKIKKEIPEPVAQANADLEKEVEQSGADVYKPPELFGMFPMAEGQVAEPVPAEPGMFPLGDGQVAEPVPAEPGMFPIGEGQVAEPVPAEPGMFPMAEGQVAEPVPAEPESIEKALDEPEPDKEESVHPKETDRVSLAIEKFIEEENALSSDQENYSSAEQDNFLTTDQDDCPNTEQDNGMDTEQNDNYLSTEPDNCSSTEPDNCLSTEQENCLSTEKDNCFTEQDNCLSPEQDNCMNTEQDNCLSTEQNNCLSTGTEQLAV